MRVGIVTRGDGHVMFALDFVTFRKILQVGVALNYIAILWRKRASEMGSFLDYVRTNPALWIMEIFFRFGVASHRRCFRGARCFCRSMCAIFWGPNLDRLSRGARAGHMEKSYCGLDPVPYCYSMRVIV